MSEAFWRDVGTIDATREANVEIWLVLPLLKALGHEERNVDSKVPIYFQEGRNKQAGRKPEADFIVYSEQPFSRANSLITVETKRNNEGLDDGRDQGESYAQNQRTPILLMTNGVRLEVWQIQITTDSRLVFEANVADLASRRSDLEALLSREAIKSHCATIEFKSFDLLARDLGSYERALHNRSALAARFSIPRTIHEHNKKSGVEWHDILSMPGALVVGASGYGKTTLASALIWEAIERRWEGKMSMLPFDLFLPNLALGQAVEGFLADRVAAHKPGFSASMLAKIAREQGLLVIADGFERVNPKRRDDVERILHTLVQDYPKIQLIVLSRANVAPTRLALRRLTLQGYDRDDLHALAKKRAGTHPHAENAFWSAPDHVYRFGAVPLLADRLLDRFETQRTHAPRITSLFEQWLDAVLTASNLVDRALDRALLEKIAEETTSGPIAVERAMELATPQSEASEILRRLAEADAIKIYGSMVELQHEILADYLRAVRIWSVAKSSGIPAQLPQSFDTASLFAILIIDTASTAKDRALERDGIMLTHSRH